MKNAFLHQLFHSQICSNSQQKPSFSCQIYDLILDALQHPSSLSSLQKIHTRIITHGLLFKSVLACRLISNYSMFSCILDAQKVFEHLPKPTLHCHNYMLKSYSDHKYYKSVIRLYSRMISSLEFLPDSFTCSFVMGACTALRAEKYGKLLHSHVLVKGFESDIHLETGIIGFYCKCRCIGDARKVFDKMMERDVFVWTTMIHGYLQAGNCFEGLNMFSSMKDAGFKISVVTWNALVTGFAHSGRVGDALCEFQRMQVEGVRPDNVSLATILPVFAHYAILKSGLEAHAYIVRMGLEFDVIVVSSLIDMYGKCGELRSARRLFDQVQVKDTGLWNVMILGYGIHGHCVEALKLFHGMQYSDVTPNGITFTCILSACSHAGFVAEGCHCFNSMVCDYGITPCHEHYVCMVDMYGRAGLLEEAYEFIKRMPIEPMKDVWGAFLGACKNHHNWKLAEIAGRHIFGSKDIGNHAGYHVMMSNIYAETGQWSDVAEFRTSIRDGALKKRTGFSWIQVGDTVDIFYTADKSHPKSNLIYALLRSFVRY